tara:strand:- start:3238 stop:4533 length:1296 start_codon:yes stop_codon:yes gene_type:complete
MMQPYKANHSEKCQNGQLDIDYLYMRIMQKFRGVFLCICVISLMLCVTASWSAEIKAGKSLRAFKNLSQCQAELHDVAGGWCEMRLPGKHPGISALWPKVDDRIHQVTGPKSVLIAWNSAAYDRRDQVLYFMGGGHADYGGNEVYSFDLKVGEWQRLTDPSALSYFTNFSGGRFKWIPDTRIVPGAFHTYDGLIFRDATRTILVSSLGSANGAQLTPTNAQLESDKYLKDGGGAMQYEFNPSPLEQRNGLDPLQWRRIGTHNLFYPKSVQLPDGRIFLGSRNLLREIQFAKNGSIKLGKQGYLTADHGDGLALYDENRDMIWSIHAKVLLGFERNGKLVKKISNLPFSSKSLAFDVSGSVVIWDGRHRVAVLDPDNKNGAWSVKDWADRGPQNGDGRVYGKWVHLGANYFVGISSDKHGVWIYKHAAESGK